MNVLCYPFDVVARWLALGVLLFVFGFTMYTVGVARGRHQERNAEWRACVARYERTALVRVGDPCQRTK